MTQRDQGSSEKIMNDEKSQNLMKSIKKNSQNYRSDEIQKIEYSSIQVFKYSSIQVFKYLSL